MTSVHANIVIHTTGINAPIYFFRSLSFTYFPYPLFIADCVLNLKYLAIHTSEGLPFLWYWILGFKNSYNLNGKLFSVIIKHMSEIILLCNTYLRCFYLSVFSISVINIILLSTVYCRICSKTVILGYPRIWGITIFVVSVWSFKNSYAWNEKLFSVTNRRKEWNYFT